MSLANLSHEIILSSKDANLFMLSCHIFGRDRCHSVKLKICFEVYKIQCPKKEPPLPFLK